MMALKDRGRFAGCQLSMGFGRSKFSATGRTGMTVRSVPLGQVVVNPGLSSPAELARRLERGDLGCQVASLPCSCTSVWKPSGRAVGSIAQRSVG